MSKTAISITLSPENLLWLRGRTGMARARSVSEVLDRLVTAARTGGSATVPRSVVGSIDVSGDDPALERADEAIRALFLESLGRPERVHERAPSYRLPQRAVRKPRG